MERVTAYTRAYTRAYAYTRTRADAYTRRAEFLRFFGTFKDIRTAFNRPQDAMMRAGLLLAAAQIGRPWQRMDMNIT